MSSNVMIQKSHLEALNLTPTRSFKDCTLETKCGVFLISPGELFGANGFNVPLGH